MGSWRVNKRTPVVIIAKYIRTQLPVHFIRQKRSILNWALKLTQESTNPLEYQATNYPFEWRKVAQ